MNGPTAHISNIICQNFTGGTGSFQSLSVAGTQSAFAGSLSVGGAISGASLWNGVATLATALGVPQYAMGSCYQGHAFYYHL